MSLLYELADKLSEEAVAAVKRTGDVTIIDKVGKTLADTSSTLQEAFLTSVRLRTAAERGHQTLKALMRGEEVDILDNPNL